MTTELLPWGFTALAILSTSFGHIFYKIYVISKNKWLLMSTGLTFILIPFWSYLALRDLTIAQVYLSTALVPVITTFSGAFILKEKVNKHNFIGLILIFLGTILYLWNSLQS